MFSVDSSGRFSSALKDTDAHTKSQTTLQSLYTYALATAGVSTEHRKVTYLFVFTRMLINFSLLI